jgi:hypothetical protein
MKARGAVRGSQTPAAWQASVEASLLAKPDM